MTQSKYTVADQVQHEHMEALRIRIEDLILNSRETAAAAVLDVIASSPIGDKVIRSGFGGSLNQASRVTFSEFCVKHDAVAVLRAVVEADREGITHWPTYWSTCCSKSNVAGNIVSGWRQSLHIDAVMNSNPEALRLALTWDPYEKCIFENTPSLMGSLHRHALIKAFISGEPGAAECCRLLIAAKAPFVRKSDRFGFASGIFFDSQEWEPVCVPVITNLLADYVAAGLVDLNTPPEGLNTPYHGMLPLRAAMGQGNISGAVACIDLGCNIAKAMEFKCPERNDDIIELARSLKFENIEHENTDDPAGLRSRMAAGITAALMRRALREETMVPSAPSPERARQRARV